MDGWIPPVCHWTVNHSHIIAEQTWSRRHVLRGNSTADFTLWRGVMPDVTHFSYTLTSYVTEKLMKACPLYIRIWLGEEKKEIPKAKLHLCKNVSCIQWSFHVSSDIFTWAIWKIVTPNCDTRHFLIIITFKCWCFHTAFTFTLLMKKNKKTFEPNVCLLNCSPLYTVVTLTFITCTDPLSLCSI